ncbi:uncharacterized protein [Dermacentor andersoni]|uniref:uncharacterized protein n=1 Tax=Dermacentor andersoni TaxID=34620 RepID=UPI0021554267|nr:uncharacterized protein LOC126527748 [Dermacentor andersoni]
MSLMISTLLPGITDTCSSSARKDCWLCEEVTQWNFFLRPFCLELEEEEAGNLCLRTLTNAWRYDNDTFDVVNGVGYSTTYALACLTHQHRCIKRLSLGHHVFESRGTPSQVETVVEALGPESAVECIEISGGATRYWNSLLNAVGSVAALRSLRIEDAVIDSCLVWRLAELFAANGGRLQELVISASEAVPDIPRQLICAIDQCEALTELSLDGHLALEATTALERLLQSNKSIQKISLRDRRQNQAFLSALCSGLSLNFSPTELQYECANLNFGELLKLLTPSRVLKHLVLSGDKCKPGTFGKHHGMALNMLLAHNAELRSLAVRHCTWTLDAAEEVASGISLNDSLERFDLSQCHMDINTVMTLCSGLETNDTLKVLRFHPDEKFLHAPTGLSGKLLAARCFTRVVTTWPEVCVGNLARALKTPALCPPELHISTSGFSDTSFAWLCAALGPSTIKHLSAKFSNCDFNPAMQLRDAVIANCSIKTLALQEDSIATDVCFTVAEALEKNRTVTEISLSINNLNERNVKYLSSVATGSDVLEKVSLNCITVVPWFMDHLRSISFWLKHNGTLTGFYIFEERRRIECVVAEVKDSVDKNRRKWKCALQFVLEPRINKCWAEAFESLQKKPCFLPRVAAAAGKSLEDASRIIRSAERFIAKNYLLVTEVVSRGVTCHPHQRTQVDSLNSDCWLVIGQYLSVFDVLDKGPTFANSDSSYGFTNV